MVLQQLHKRLWFTVSDNNITTEKQTYFCWGRLTSNSNIEDVASHNIIKTIQIAIPLMYEVPQGWLREHINPYIHTQIPEKILKGHLQSLYMWPDVWSSVKCKHRQEYDHTRHWDQVLLISTQKYKIKLMCAQSSFVLFVCVFLMSAEYV